MVTASDLNVTRLHNGAWEVATVANGQRIHMTYYGLTKREAVRSFLSDVNERASNPDLSRVAAIGSNMTEAIHGTATILYSYETPVAVHVEGIGYFKTDKKWSVTTSKHINTWLERHGASEATVVPQDEIEKLARKGGQGAVDVRGTRTSYTKNPKRDQGYRRLGSISSGTLASADLLEAFSTTLRDEYFARRMPPDVKKLLAEVDAVDPDVEEEEAKVEELVDELHTFLEALAPPYGYFGGLEGDPADIGYWIAWDAIRDAIHDKSMIQVEDLSEVPRGYTGEVLHVNDHGNTTLYVASRGKLKEIWAVV